MYSILIVDDEPLTREYMKVNIPSIHDCWTVSGEAGDGAEALEFLEKHTVDLVITDIKMPILSGLELCKNISQKYPGQKIIILSGYDEFSYAKEAILYGVNEYLLKPIIKEELRTALDNILKKLQDEKNRELAYNSLVNLSIDSKAHIARKFLQSLINESAVEIKTLHPLIYRMRINLMEGEGAVLLLSLDEEVLIRSDLPVNDLSIYRYILNQIAGEIAEKSNVGWAFLDSAENTCILISGEDTETVRRSCMETADRINTRMRENTGLTVTAGMGTPINDLLQLNQSYKAADLLIISGLLPGSRYFYTYADGDLQTRLKQTDEVIAAVKLLKSGFMDGNEMNYSLALAKLSDLIDCTDIEAVIKCGIYIIKSIVSLKADCPTENTEGALKLLKSFSENNGGFLSKGEAVKLFKGIIGLLPGNSTGDETVNRKRIFSEEGVIDQAKDYIFTHYSEPVSLALIAENVGVSSGYLSQLFHKTVGESYIQFLTRIRMEQAAKLLCAYPDERISNICEKVGYLGVKHFTYVFKQYFKVTPGEYQNNCKVFH